MTPRWGPAMDPAHLPVIWHGAIEQVSCLGQQVKRLVNKWGPVSAEEPLNRITEDIKLQAPVRVPRKQSAMTANIRWNSASAIGVMTTIRTQSSNNHGASQQGKGVLVATYERKELTSARWPVRANMPRNSSGKLSDRESINCEDSLLR